VVAFTRCPYCGHSEVELTASACPICDGELAQELEVSGGHAVLGSLSESAKSIDLEALLETPKLSESEAEVKLAIDLAGRAHTLEDVRMSDLLDLDLNQSKSGLDQPKLSTIKVSPPTQPKRSSNGVAGLSIYLYLLFFALGTAGLYYVAVSKPLVTADLTQGISGKNERLGLKAIEQGRYAAAVKLLERATALEQNISLLPYLALAYSQTSQVERARQVMRTYRLALQKRRTDN
jgi:hypothetical protein